MKINCIWSLCFHLLLYVPYTSRCAVPTTPAGAAIECRLSTVFQSCSPWNPLCIIDASMTSVRNDNWLSWQVLLCHCTEVKSERSAQTIESVLAIILDTDELTDPRSQVYVVTIFGRKDSAGCVPHPSCPMASCRIAWINSSLIWGLRDF